jgi:hypothetical protein
MRMGRVLFNSFDEQWVDYRHVERRRVVSGNDAVWEGTGQGTWKTTGKPVEFPISRPFLTIDVAGSLRAAAAFCVGNRSNISHHDEKRSAGDQELSLSS